MESVGQDLMPNITENIKLVQIPGQIYDDQIILLMVWAWGFTAEWFETFQRLNCVKY